MIRWRFAPLEPPQTAWPGMDAPLFAAFERPALAASEVAERRRRLAPVDPEQLRADIVGVVDTSF